MSSVGNAGRDPFGNLPEGENNGNNRRRLQAAGAVLAVSAVTALAAVSGLFTSNKREGASAACVTKAQAEFVSMQRQFNASGGTSFRATVPDLAPDDDTALPLYPITIFVRDGENRTVSVNPILLGCEQAAYATLDIPAGADQDPTTIGLSYHSMRGLHTESIDDIGGSGFTTHKASLKVPHLEVGGTRHQLNGVTEVGDHAPDHVFGINSALLETYQNGVG
jgi:hypothetical protein